MIGFHGAEPEARSMKRNLVRGVAAIAVGAACAFVAIRPVRAEIVEEIVAKVNDDIITKSDLDTEEQAALEEVYQKYSGTDLDAQVKKTKDGLLRNIIDRKILTQRAPRLFDMAKMEDYFLQSFKEQQNIKSDSDLEKLLAKEGMSIADWKKRLVELFAPQQVIRSEVVDRVAVSEQEAQAYYDAHTEDFRVPTEATVREIVIKSGDADRDAKRAEAEAVRAEAAKPGADFAALAKEKSDAGTKDKGGLLGTVKKGDLAPALEAAAFTVPVGEVSPVIEADYGFHILKVDARTDTYVKPFDIVRDDVEKTIENAEVQKQIRIYLKKLWSEATVWVAPQYQSRLSPDDPTPPPNP